MARLVSLHSLLAGCSTELRQPINLEQQLLASQGADSEVAASMVQLLQVSLPPLLYSQSFFSHFNPSVMCTQSLFPVLWIGCF